MPTLRAYFDSDFALLAVTNEITATTQDGRQIKFIGRVHYDTDAHVYFVSAFVGADQPLDVVRGIIVNTSWHAEVKKDLHIVMGGLDSPVLPQTMPFSGKVFAYVEHYVPPDVKRALEEPFGSGLIPTVRDLGYAVAKSAVSKPLAFICHDSRNKETIARPLALGLARLMCPVWYDEFSLRPGDRLRATIEKGLKECPRCVIVVTPSFLSNPGWPQTEFTDVFHREHLQKREIVIPVWHDVTPHQVADNSLSLYDRYAAKWSSGVDEVCRQLASVIKATPTP